MKLQTEKLRSSAGKRRFQQRLLAWFDQHKRDLPWRRDRDPYHVWLSEIMLQQTRVAAVIDHYHQFLDRFPTVEKLAAAREPSVLAVWSGLGYYRRARMLHAAAKAIVSDHGGAFPTTSDAWQDLPGIGRYTAAAIASIAFDEPVAVVDGNVERVLQRLCGQHLKGDERWDLAQEMLSPSRPGDFNQAMMELGATVCVPGSPKCLACPVADLCSARGDLPKSEKPARQQKRELHYALARRNGSVLLVQRPNTLSLMPGMWELPEIGDARAPRNAPPRASGSARGPHFTLRHSITVTDYLVHVHHADAVQALDGKWTSTARLRTLPLTGLARKILRATKML